MVDIDLSILGQSGPRFQAYEANIRKEYRWVPADIFASKRAEILENFLAREQIYYTKHFFHRYESTARANLRESLHQLRRS
jgi:predicted metal-dependent HD superfamily phosphohydrolase